MKIKFTGRGSYFASPFHFTERDRTHEIDKELGQHLLKNKNFKEILEEKTDKGKKNAKNEPKKDEVDEDDSKDKTQQEVEEESSKEKEKLENAKKETKKATDKK